MKIDIIIPCYKAHKTLPRLLGSILSQTIIDDLKVTLVNDGDEKDYQEIIKPFKNFMDIQELKLEKNSGPGAARRYGYENTNNSYVVWADADDTFYGAFALQYLKETSLLDENIAISIGNFIEEETIIINSNKPRLIPHSRDTIWVFGKLYKREFLDKYQIKMNNTRSNEDNGFNTLCKILSSEENQIRFVNQSIYMWHARPDSITRINNCDYTYNASFKGFVDNMLWVFKELERISKNFDLSKFHERILYEKVSILIHLYVDYIETIALEPKYKKQNWKECLRYYTNVYKNIENEVPREMFESVWCEFVGDRYNLDNYQGYIPSISIYEFLNELKKTIKTELLYSSELKNIW